MNGDSQLQWGFICKVYGVIAAQLVLTTVVSSITVIYFPINNLLRGNFTILFFFLFLHLFLLWPMAYLQSHPLNLILRGLFIVSLTLTVGVMCANPDEDGRIMLESFILTSTTAASFTGYASWAAKKGKDFSYFGSILFSSLFTIIMAGFLQMFLPLESTSVVIHGGIKAVIMSGYMVYDTDKQMKSVTHGHLPLFISTSSTWSLPFWWFLEMVGMPGLFSLSLCLYN